MKSIFQSIARFFTGPKMVEPVKMTNVAANNSYSQPNVLAGLMQQNRMTHGETVLADISPVRVMKDGDDTMLYFCPADSLNIKETLTVGDGGRIPYSVKVEGLQIPDELKSGLYNLKNVQLTSNGTIQVIPTLETAWEQHYMK